MNRTVRKVISISIVALGAFAGVGMFLFSGGCSATYSRTELNEAVAASRLDTLGAIYYKGRKSGHDYFQARRNVGSKNFRVAMAESPVIEPFDYTSDKAKWRVEPSLSPDARDPEASLPKRLNAD